MSINNTVIYYEDGLLNNYRELNIKDIDIYIYIYIYIYILYADMLYVYIYMLYRIGNFYIFSMSFIVIHTI